MRLKRWIVGLVLLAAIGLGAWLFRGRLRKETQAGLDKSAQGGDRAVSVVATAVARRDVPIQLEGLGTVTAFGMVTVKSQVEGRLEQVTFREGQEVKKGELLAQIDPRPFQIQVHQAQSSMARDSALLRGAKLNLERITALHKEGLASQQQLDDQRTLVDQAAAATQADMAQMESARLSLDYARITAPIDGVTGVRLIDPGNMIRNSDQTGLVVITQVQPIAVLFTLPQDDLPRVSREMSRGPLVVEALSRDGATVLGTGKVEVIDNQINQTTATIRLKSIFANADRALWPNQFVKARLLLTVRKGALVVPAAVVQRGPQGPFAYVIGADQKVAARPIEIETQTGDTTVIAKGLEEGEQVVVEGQYQLRPGAKVAPKGDGARGGDAPKGGEGSKPGEGSGRRAAPAGSAGAHP